MSIDEVKAQGTGEETEAATPKLSPEAAGNTALKNPKAPVSKASKPESWLDTAVTLLIAVAIAVFVRCFLFQPFNIPSESMKSTLLVGDFLFVSKYSYGYSKHSLPFSLPLIPGRIFFSEPKRGDVIVFKMPNQRSDDYMKDFIKRVIGLPGDHVQMIRGHLFVNGQEVPKVPVADYVETDRYGIVRHIPRYRETLPGTNGKPGKSYFVLDQMENGPADDTREFIVPPDSFFMMGDNRDNSNDSRMDVGFVPKDDLVGKAELLFFSVEAPRPSWAIWSVIRYGRVFRLID